MRKTVVAAVAAVVLVAGAGSAYALTTGDDETVATGTCGASTFTFEVEPDDGTLEASLELQSTAPGETWTVVIEQDGTPILQGERLTDEDAELDVDVTASADGGETFTATATPTDGDPCVATVTR